MTNGLDLGRRSEKPSFSLTCSLLSQYIKEKGVGIQALSIDTITKGRPEEPPATMNLMPGAHVCDDGHGEVKEKFSSRNATKSMELFPNRIGIGRSEPPAVAKEPVKAQLTMFYGGKVLVFDNFKADKAMELMQLASKASSASSVSPASFPTRLPPNFSDLPLARNASLHRFMQKRKERIGAKAPYRKNSHDGSKGAVAVKQEEVGSPWLG